MTTGPYYDDGQCQIWHGDCRDVLPTLNLAAVASVIADPPYGETALPWDRWPDGWVATAAAWLPVTTSLWCFGSMRTFLAHRDEFDGWRLAQDVVWEKQSGSGFQADRFRRVHENIVQWYRGAWRDVYRDPQRVIHDGPNKGRVRARRFANEHLGKNGLHRWEDDGTRMIRSVLPIQSMHRRARHPTEKPLGVVVPLVLYSVPPGGLVLDPFMGSGTTLRAAKDLGRRAVGIEIEERYCELAARRLAQEALPLETA